jgi:hypothetical protein
MLFGFPVDLTTFMACYKGKSIGTPQSADFRSYHVHHFGSGSSISLSTLHHHCYRRQRKTRYMVELVLLPQQDFHL